MVQMTLAQEILSTNGLNTKKNVNKKVTENLFRLLLLLNPMTLFKNGPWTGVSDSNISIVSHSTDQQIQNQSNEMNRDFNWHLWHFQQQKTLKHVKLKWC